VLQTRFDFIVHPPLLIAIPFSLTLFCIQFNFYLKHPHFHPVLTFSHINKVPPFLFEQCALLPYLAAIFPTPPSLPPIWYSLFIFFIVHPPSSPPLPVRAVQLATLPGTQEGCPTCPGRCNQTLPYEIKHLPGTQEGCPTCPGRWNQTLPIRNQALTWNTGRVPNLPGKMKSNTPNTKSNTYLEHRKGAQLAREDEIKHSQYEIKHLPGTQEGCPVCPGRWNQTLPIRNQTLT